MNKFIINGLVFLIGILALIFKDELVKLYKKFTEKKKSEVEVENNEETPSGRSLWDSLWDITQEIVLISLPFFIALFFVEGHRKAIYVSWIIFFAFSVYEVKAGEVAIKTQFGKIIRGYEKNTGLVLVCWWLRGLKKMSVKIKQFQIPDEPENIYWTDPQSPDFELPGGKSLPIWVNTAGPETADYTLDFDKETKERYNKAQNDAEKKVIIDEVKSLYNGDPLHKRMPIPMDGTFAYRTGTAEDFVLFYINVKTEESLRKLVRDVFERVLNEEAAHRTLAMMLKNRATIDRRLQSELKKLVGDFNIDVSAGEIDLNGSTDRIRKVDSFGLRVVKAQIVDIKISDLSKKAMDNEVSAGINAKTKIITAKGEGEAREIAAKAEKTWEQLTGEGKAQAAYMMLMKQSEGYKKMATDLDVPANIVIALETAKELMQKGQSNTIIYGDNPIFGQLFATLPALKDLLIEKTKEINKEA